MSSPPMSSNGVQRVVFVTGASAGIGAELAREAARRGAVVVLFARRADRLSHVAQSIREAGGQSLEVVGDVTSEADLQRAVEQTLNAFGRIDCVLANAGFGVRGLVEALTVADYQRQFDTNVFGVLKTVHAALPALKRSRGAIGIIGSVNGYLDVPDWSAYCMSKAAIRSLSACLRYELNPHGVSVTHLAPGMVKSDFRKADNFGAFDATADDPVPNWLAMDAELAAAQMIDAVESREGERVITWHAKAIVALQRHAHWAVDFTVNRAGWLVQRLSKGS